MNTQSGQIISASRRSDIPAFYGNWFLQQVQKGFIDVPNPFSKRTFRVSLAPDEVSAIVFWSKDYSSFVPILDIIDPIYQKRFLFHFTINGYRDRAKLLFEPNIPDQRQAIETAVMLSERYGKHAVLWRFDPIILSSASTMEKRIAAFSELARQLEGKTVRCFISFVDLYGKVRQRFEKTAAGQRIEFIKPSLKERIDIACELRQIAGKHGITVSACCEDDIIEGAGIQKAHCIDSTLLSQLYPDVEFPRKISPTRTGCGCYESRDIGTYNTCENHCLYCYACR
ncbi:MAG: DUF1848 domain-containing protein [Candidatus Marinimicrobia bacterium]|nr:DUF1848 domain-containing protein [Candidatus Neomarinimicrobiota bacterium]